MAGTFARATGKPAFVELHIAPGLGNAGGMLFNAKSAHSPLVVYVGLEPAIGFEPMTCALRMRCSTAELRRLCWQWKYTRRRPRQQQMLNLYRHQALSKGLKLTRFRGDSILRVSAFAPPPVISLFFSPPAVASADPGGRLLYSEAP
jgi:hypothetical protein